MSAPTLQIAGHFGEFLQGRIGPAGPIALLTLPCPTLFCQATRHDGPFSLMHHGPQVLTPEDLRHLLRALGRAAEGRFVLRTEMPVGAGAGASTAARVALARAGGEVDPLRIARACIAVEGASDPLMFAEPERLLWASRAGRVLDRLPPLPPMEVIGGLWGPPQRTDPADERFAEIGDLVETWQTGDGGLPTLAQVASTSARRCLALRGPAGDPTEALAARLGAEGFAIAHTGSARALIFAPGKVPPEAAMHLQQAGYARITRFNPGGA